VRATKRKANDVVHSIFPYLRRALGPYLRRALGSRLSLLGFRGAMPAHSCSPIARGPCRTQREGSCVRREACLPCACDRRSTRYLTRDAGPNAPTRVVAATLRVRASLAGFGSAVALARFAVLASACLSTRDRAGSFLRTRIRRSRRRLPSPACRVVYPVAGAALVSVVAMPSSSRLDRNLAEKMGMMRNSMRTRRNLGLSHRCDYPN
jgi:hypothetical protein